MTTTRDYRTENQLGDALHARLAEHVYGQDPLRLDSGTYIHDAAAYEAADHRRGETPIILIDKNTGRRFSVEIHVIAAEIGAGLRNRDLPADGARVVGTTAEMAEAARRLREATGGAV